MKYKYSVTTFWLSYVKQNKKGTITWVNRWKRVSKHYFRTKKEALLYASKHVYQWVKKTIKKEVL